MARFKFDDIAINSIEKKKPAETDKNTYLGLEHLDSANLTVTRFGSDVAPIGEKLIMKKGDVLFGKRRAYQKKVAIAPFDGIFSAHGMVLRPKEAVIDRCFFPLFISSDYFLDAAIKISVGSLSPTINWSTLKELEFNLPSLEDQKRLATLLWAIIETKSAYKRLQILTDQLVKSRFIEMFGDKMIGKYRWHTVKLFEVCDNRNDIKCGPFGSQLHNADYKTCGVPVYAIPQVNSAFKKEPTDFLTPENAARLNDFSLLPGDIAVSRKGNIGTCALFSKDLTPGIIHSDVLRIRVNPKTINQIFLITLLHNNQDVRTQIEQVSYGTVMAGTNVTKLKNIQFPLPPLNLQNRFAAFVEQADKSKFMVSRLLQVLFSCIIDLLSGKGGWHV
jgi:type I restriction enzyme S subunit